MTLPPYIQIGPLAYRVVAVEELAGEHGMLHGDIDYQKCRIRVSADDDPQIQRVTLWHETLPGILHQAACADHNEQVIDALAHGIIQALRDNPELRHVA